MEPSAAWTREVRWPPRNRRDKKRLMALATWPLLARRRNLMPGEQTKAEEVA